VAESHDTTPPGQWKAGAKALHTFQQAAYAAGKSGRAQGRAFSSLKDICKTIKESSEGTGLSHAETWRALGTDHAVLTVTLHHESGESISSELPVDITQKNRSGSREQAQGSAMTYARRYLLLGIYGLANDDEDDDGEATTTVSTSKPSRSSTPKDSPEPPSPATASTPAPQPVPVEKSEQPAKPQPVELNPAEKDAALKIIADDKKTGGEIKKKFMAKFYPEAAKLYPNMIAFKEHLAFLDSAQIPF